MGRPIRLDARGRHSASVMPAATGNRRGTRSLDCPVTRPKRSRHGPRYVGYIHAKKHALPYRLLSDPTRTVIGALTGTKASTKRRYVAETDASHFVVGEDGTLTLSTVGVKPGEVRGLMLTSRAQVRRSCRCRRPSKGRVPSETVCNVLSECAFEELLAREHTRVFNEAVERELLRV